MATQSNLATRRDQYLGAGTTLFYERPVHLVSGEGVYLFDPDGRRYVDMYNNVPCVGHCHPHVVEAITRQVSTLNVHSRYLHEGVVDYAARLVGKLHSGLENTVFTCTGTEANEVAIIMARIATGARGIICTDESYHGNSDLVSQLTRCRATSGEVRSIPWPDTYRYDGDVDATDYYLDCLDQVIAGFKRDGVGIAGMLICPIFANEGLPELPDGLLAKAMARVHEAGGLMISDEVQAGLCRAGRWWGYEVAGIEPDIVTLGKPIGSGVPVAAAISSRSIVEKYRQQTRYFNTFASSPLQAAAGNAVLDVLENEDLVTNSASVGGWLLDRLGSVSQRYDFIGDVRGCGLFLGLEWVTDRQSKMPDVAGAERMVNALKDKGFLISNAGAYDNVLKLRPPLVFSKDDAEAFVQAFEATLDEIYG